MSARRPYIYEDREWLEIAQIQEKQDVQSDEIPQSELDQPYRFGNDDDDNYQPYEFDLPNCPTCGPWVPPGWPPPDPVPIPGPCDQGTGCDFVTITSVPEEIECDTTYQFTTIHVVSGCEPASFEDAFLSWSITAGTIINTTPPGMKWKADGVSDGQEVTVCVSSADGSCSDCRTFKISCPVCCSDQMEIVGADTVNAGSTWAGSIDPPCPGATCSVSSNAGCPMTCSINPDGSTVSVPVGIKNCGSFTVTVTEDTSTPQKIEDMCPGESATKTVRINDNSSWISCGSCSWFLCNGPFCSCEYFSGEERWRIWIGAGIFCGACCTAACYDNWQNRPPLGNIIWGPRTFCASTCDTNGPCAGSSMWGTSLWYWGNPNCECF